MGEHMQTGNEMKMSVFPMPDCLERNLIVIIILQDNCDMYMNMYV